MVQVTSSMVLVVALALLAGCTSSKGTFCALSQPVRVSKETIETMTEAEVKEALIHNELGSKLCGWQR